MKFLTLNQRQMLQGSSYTGIKENHLLIVIKNPKAPVDIPKTPYCRAVLELEFDNTEELDNNLIYFDQDMARQLIEFMNNHCHKGGLTVCVSTEGVARNVAVAAALSKILNNKDDDVFNLGIPNMLVYSTILEEYFIGATSKKPLRGIQYSRNESLKYLLSGTNFKLNDLKVRSKIKGN